MVDAVEGLQAIVEVMASKVIPLAGHWLGMKFRASTAMNLDCGRWRSGLGFLGGGGNRFDMRRVV